MGANYYAYNKREKKYFSPPNDLGGKSFQIFQPWNPFPNMLVMMNVYGGNTYWQLGSDEDMFSPYSLDGYEDITEEVYGKYRDKTLMETK